MSLKSAEYVRKYKMFLRRLRHAREAAGLDQTRVARCFGKPQSFVSKCESGERRVDFVELQEFAKLYKKPIQYFTGTD
jgi:transcriptional regulator with XRE-family HTH domain